MTTHASIVPLIGGLPIAQQNVFGTKPSYSLSYEPFYNNDRHFIEYTDVSYYSLSEVSEGLSVPPVDVIGATCPCAGLSSLSPSSSSDSSTNDWMIESASYVLNQIKPKVFWGENAPRLAGKMGKPIVDKIKAIGKDNGYSMSIVKTMSKIHGLSQTRDRTFYFFWQGDKIPLFNFMEKPRETIVETILNANVRDDDPMSQQLVKDGKPSDDPYYRYVLEELEGGITHQQFQEKIENTENVMCYIEERTTYDKVGKWMEKEGYAREVPKCFRRYDKLASGKNIMRHAIQIPKTYIGAFVGSLPRSITHPYEDRFLNIRECLSIMKMPDDFQLIGGKRNLNHICQNVPVTTAMAMAEQIQMYLNNELPLIDAEFMLFDNKSKKYEAKNSSLQLTEFML